MRRLPIDTTGMTFAVAEGPRRLTDFETKQPRVSEDGEPLFSVGLQRPAGDVGPPAGLDHRRG